MVFRGVLMSDQQQPPSGPRVYRVYHDSDDGKMVYVTAKNRKEARRVAGINSTHVTWCPWLKWVNGQAVDEWGRVQENKL